MEPSGVDAVRTRTKWIIALVVAAVLGAGLLIAVRPGSPDAALRAGCPQFTPMHGLMPLLFRLGILPKPPSAASIAPSDMAGSILIHPERSDQIQCGKTPIRSIENIVYAVPKTPDGKSTSLK